MTADAGARWSDPAWRAEIESWARVELEARGRLIVGSIEQPHVRPWSTTLRIPTDEGDVWAKACASGTAYEAGLLQAFAAWDVPFVLRPIAADPARGWLLLPDGGTTLRATRPNDTGDHDLDAWKGILADYATLQRSVEARAGELLGIGVPDGRPETLAATLARLVDDDAIWLRVEPAELDAAMAARDRLRSSGPQIAAWVEILTKSGIAATIQHDDLHSNNVFVGASGPRFFDWGDSAVAHPFGTLFTTLNSIAWRLEIDPAAAELEPLREAYLDAWSSVLSHAALREVLEAALIMGRIGRAAAWDRALAGLGPSEMDGHGDAPAAMLMDLAGLIGR